MYTLQIQEHIMFDIFLIVGISAALAIGGTLILIALGLVDV